MQEEFDKEHPDSQEEKLQSEELVGYAVDFCLPSLHPFLNRYYQVAKPAGY